MSERGYEAIVAIAIFPRWVRLYFDKSLPDPKGLLEGSDAKVRSVTLKAALDLDHGYPGTHQGCDQARRGHLPAHPLDPHGHQVGVEEAETEENRARLPRRCGGPRRGIGGRFPCRILPAGVNCIACRSTRRSQSPHPAVRRREIPVTSLHFAATWGQRLLICQARV